MKSENINVRVTPETKRGLELLAKLKNKSMARVVETLIKQAMEMGLGDQAEQFLEMNDDPEIKPTLEYLAYTNQWFQALDSRYELTEEFLEDYAKFVSHISGLLKGMYIASIERKRQAKSN